MLAPYPGLSVTEAEHMESSIGKDEECAGNKDRLGKVRHVSSRMAQVQVMIWGVMSRVGVGMGQVYLGYPAEMGDEVLKRALVVQLLHQGVCIGRCYYIKMTWHCDQNE